MNYYDPAMKWLGHRLLTFPSYHPSVVIQVSFIISTMDEYIQLKLGI